MKNQNQNSRPTKRKSKKYFTKFHEDAIIAYRKSADKKVRNDLYIKIIQPALLEMVDKIVYTYKFTNLPNIESLKMECLGHLVQILSRFDEKKESKAFSYFSVVTKNWFIHKVKKNSSQIKKESQYEEISKAIEIEYLSTNNDYINNRNQEEFLKYLWVEINKWEKQSLKVNEKKILEAIKILLSQPDAIEIFNKKAIYLYCRELTNLNTKQILNNINKFRSLYKEFKHRWDNGYPIWDNGE